MKSAVTGAIATAAISTIGDYLWMNVIPHGIVFYWFAHAIVLFATIGAFLGLPSGKPLAGAAGAVLVGCGATLGFYLLRPVIGYAAAMFLLFCLMWVGIGVLAVRVLQGRTGTSEILARSAIAAVGSGLGFYVVSGIWFPFNPRGWDYAVHFGAWIVAYLPAFLALLVVKSPVHSPTHESS